MAPILDKIFDIFCKKKVWRVQSLLTVVKLHEMSGRMLGNKRERSLGEITGQILVGGESNQIEDDEEAQYLIFRLASADESG